MCKVLESSCIKEFVLTCDRSWKKGWNERNGGNLSYRMKKEEVDEIRDYFDTSREWIAIGVTVENLAGEYFTVTGSGRYFMNTFAEPEKNICIIEVDDKGENYRIVWGLTEGGKPTSELPTHLINHSVKKAKTNGEYRVIIHTHPTNIITLTFLLSLDDKSLTRELWSSMTECPIIMPGGVGVVPWMVCGSSEIAYATAEKIEKYDVVIWSHHGVFCCGTDFNSTFGLLDAVEKSAEIAVKVRSCGGRRQTISDRQILSLSEPFGVDIDKSMLD